MTQNSNGIFPSPIHAIHHSCYLYHNISPTSNGTGCSNKTLQPNPTAFHAAMNCLHTAMPICMLLLVPSSIHCPLNPCISDYCMIHLCPHSNHDHTSQAQLQLEYVQVTEHCTMPLLCMQSSALQKPSLPTLSWHHHSLGLWSHADEV